MTTRTLTPQEERALMQRHTAAMKVLAKGESVDPYLLLYAVLCPSKELRDQQLDVCTQAA